MNLEDIKHDRLSEPERFMLGIFVGLEEFINDKYPDHIFYKNGDKMIFGYDSKNKHLRYSYDDIRLVLHTAFELNYQEITDLVGNMVEEYLNIRVNLITWNKYDNFNL